MALIEVGTVLYVNYFEEEWHERLVVYHIAGPEYMIVTPDYEFYVERYDRHNEDIFGFRLPMTPGQLPLGIGPDRVYGFAGMTAAQRGALLAEGRRLGELEVGVRGLGQGVAGAPAAAAAVPPAPGAGAVPPAGPLVPAAAGVPQPQGGLLGGGAAPGAPGGPVAPAAAAQPAPGTGAAGPRLVTEGGAWVLDEPADEHNIGEEFVLPAGAVTLGDRSLVTVGGEVVVLKRLTAGTDVTEYARERQAYLADDPRIVPRPTDRPMGFSEAVQAMTAMPTPLQYASPLSGPATAAWLMETVVNGGHGSLVTRHHRWRRESGISASDRAVYEHEVSSRALELLVTVDGINVKNCVGAELLCRRLQLIEEAVAECPTNPTYDGAEHFLGTGDRRGGALLAPSLRAFVAAELGREAAIMKEKRKAREGRGKGGGRGKKDDAGGPSAS